MPKITGSSWWASFFVSSSFVFRERTKRRTREMVNAMNRKTSDIFGRSRDRNHPAFRKNIKMFPVPRGSRGSESNLYSNTSIDNKSMCIYACVYVLASVYVPIFLLRLFLGFWLEGFFFAFTLFLTSGFFSFCYLWAKLFQDTSTLSTYI